MSKDILKIDPVIFTYQPNMGKDHAILWSDPKFRDRFFELFKIVNDKYLLCEISQPGPHETVFTFIPGVDSPKIIAVLYLLKIVIDQFQGDPNLAWKAGFDTFALAVLCATNAPNRVLCDQVTDRVLKLLIDQTLSDKTINVEFINNCCENIARVKKALQNIKAELPGRKSYRVYHPQMVSWVDEELKAVVDAEKAYLEATKYVLSYNESLISFLAKETLLEDSYDMIQSRLGYLKQYNDDPRSSYKDCLEVISKAQKLISAYTGYHYESEPDYSF